MLKQITFALVFCMALIPLVARADLATDLQVLQLRVQQLLIEIRNLQPQQSPVQVSESPSSFRSGTCVSLMFNMGPDDTDANTNGEVTKIQQFLTSQGVSIYPEGRVTGYFGPATTRAVQRWQATRGIATSGDPDSTGYGYVGPKTRATMACSSTFNLPASSTMIPVVENSTPACSITASPNPASFNQQVTLTWTSKNAVSAQWQSDTSGKDNVSIPPGTPGLSGAAYIVANVMGNPTVTLRVFGSNGSSNTCTTSFSVPSAVPSINGYNNSYVSLDPSSLNTTSQNPTITGSAGNLNGVAVQIYNNSNVGVSGTGFVPVTNGRWTVTVPQTLQPGVYKVEVLGAPTPVYGMLTITEPVLPTPAISFSASTYSVESGQQATLSWSASNANRCTLQFGGVEMGGMSPNGSQIVVVQQTTSYRLICTNDPGTGKDGPSSERTLTIQTVQSQALSCTLTSTSNYNSAGAAIPATLTWTSQNATHAIASQRQANNIVGSVSLGTVAANGSMVVNPGVTTDYTFTFYGSSGTKDCTYQLGYKG